MRSVLPVKYAAFCSAAIGPAVGSLPYLVYLVFEVASRATAPGLPALLKAIAGVAFNAPFVLIAAYVAAVMPAALAGAGYAYLLSRKPSISGNRWLRVLCAAAIAFAICAVWALTLGQLTIMEYVGKMAWTVIGCGVFAAIVLSIIFPRHWPQHAAA
jgi:hypothetical protein